MYNPIIDVTPSPFWAIVDKIFRPRTFYTVAYDTEPNKFVGQDWFDDNYDNEQDGIDSAQRYFDLDSNEIMYEDNLKHLKRNVCIAVAEYFLFRGERRYISARHVELHFEAWPENDR